MSKKIEIEFADIHAMTQASEAVSLIMKEKNGNRYVPIIIGFTEARAILLEVNKVKTNRPLTHELFISLADTVHCNIVKVDIVRYENGVYFADILMKKEDNTIFHLDARPSDAIALAFRSDVPVFMNGDVFEQNCVTEDVPRKKQDDRIPDILEESLTDQQEFAEIDVNQESYIDLKLTEMSTTELRDLLDGAVDSEDYELAAKIQEELDRRKA